LTASLPDPGRRSLHLDIRASELRQYPDDTFKFELKVTATRGWVQEQYPEGRDRVMVRFPALRGDQPSPAGMSGGPVVTAGSGVCGLVCSAMEAEGGWESYISLLPQLFALKTRWKDDDGHEATMSIRDLAERNVIVTEGSYKTGELREEGGLTHVAWRP